MATKIKLSKKDYVFQNAERQARLRDINKEKLLEEINELTGEEYFIGRKKRKTDRIRFAQMIQENWKYLNKINYLTTAEKAFLIDIIPYIGFDSNCIVEDPGAKNQIPLTQDQIGQAIGKNKSQVSKIIKPLIRKGILDRTEGREGENNTRTYAILVNPNIIYSGDRDNINQTLKVIFRKVPKELERLPIKLF